MLHVTREMSLWVILLSVCLASVGLVLVTAEAVALFCVLASWLTCVGTIIAGSVLIVRWRCADSGRPIGARCRAAVAIGTAALVAVCVAESLAVLAAARRSAVASISASNLRGIGHGIQLYFEEFRESPTGAVDLVAAGLSTACQFRCPLDDTLDADCDVLTEGLSYEMRLGDWACSGAPDVVVAYERLPWTPLDARIFPEYGRHVLFGNGTVRRMNEASFQRALVVDAEARAELSGRNRSGSEP